VAHEDASGHTGASFHHGASSLDLHADLHALISRPPSAAALTHAQHTAFLSMPFPNAHAKLKAKMEHIHQAGVDFQRTRLWYKGRHMLREHTKQYGLAEAFGVGALVTGAVLMKVPLPERSSEEAKAPKNGPDAAVDAFKAKRAQLAAGQAIRYELAGPNPKLPGDRIPRASASGSRRSGSSSAAWSGSGRAGGNRRAPARAPMRNNRSQRSLPEGDAEGELDSDEEEASMSA